MLSVASKEDKSLESILISTRVKLKEFLNSSKLYNAELVLAQFPHHCLHEERSILEADFDLFLDSGRISGSVT